MSNDQRRIRQFVGIARPGRKRAGQQIAHRVVWFRNVLIGVLSYNLLRKFPKGGRRLIRSLAMAALPAGYPVDVHFNPKYDPWDQRLCAVLDRDIFTAIGDGRAEVVTDHELGVEGPEVPADLRDPEVTDREPDRRMVGIEDPAAGGEREGGGGGVRGHGSHRAAC